jgi:hypothetical protein
MRVEYSTCQCGAMTVHLDSGDFSMPEDDFISTYGHEDENDIVSEYGSCNYCVNNWGTDLCACGSGEKVDECDGEFSECGEPMQSIEGGVTSPSNKLVGG